MNGSICIVLVGAPGQDFYRVCHQLHRYLSCLALQLSGVEPDQTIHNNIPDLPNITSTFPVLQDGARFVFGGNTEGDRLLGSGSVVKTSFPNNAFLATPGSVHEHQPNSFTSRAWRRRHCAINSSL